MAVLSFRERNPVFRTLWVAVIFASGMAPAGTPVPVISLDDAVTRALSQHPALSRARARVSESDARVELARTGYLPQLNVALQANRATGNVVRGAAFPMVGLPVVSGQVQASNFDSGVFGTSVALSASWDALGLLTRIAAVDVTLRDQQGAAAGLDAAALEVAFNVADRFLGALTRREAVRAARANEERAAIFERSVEALVQSELRPGADLERSRAERALAATQRIRAVQAEAIAELGLGEALAEPGPLRPDPGGLLSPSAGDANASRVRPEILVAKARSDSARARIREAGLSYLPRLEVVGSLWARGSGFSGNGVSPVANGLWPTAANWGAGLVLSWPVLEVFAGRARAMAADANARAAAADQKDVELAVQIQVDTARAVLEGAQEVAQNTPLALAAARAAEQQATARYQSGLANVTEVAEAQRLLAQAEFEDAVAHLGVRTATLLLARALGDLEPFLNDARAASPPSGGR